MMVRSDGKSLGGSGVNVLVIVVAVLVFFSGLNGVYSSGILNLQHRFASRGKSVADLKVYKAHDSRRHGRILTNIDTPIGGTADPTVAGLYYAQLGLGVPSKNYYVQVDTGSDILWVNCVPCRRCPKSSGLGVRLTLYNPDESSTGSAISCDNQFCDLASQVQGTQECKYSQPCAYGVEYGDGSSTSGYYVQDTLQYNQVTGNFKTRPANATVIFGCGAQQTGELESTDQALDGILGFGQSNTSILSQLAFQGKVRKMFAHCLDGEKGGGILAIGHVVQTNLKMTPLVQNQPHYNVNMTKMDVGGIQLEVDSTVFETGDKKGTIIDSGTTLAYISEPAFKPLINAIMSAKPDLQYAMQDGTYCFVYDGSVDDAFPDVTLYFEGDLTMNVYPHDYLLSSDNSWCIGWQDSGAQSKDNMYMTILGDLVLKNKLVVYDLENQTIGWVNYNCSSSIKMQDENGAVQYIGAHQLSQGIILRIGNFPFLLISLVAMVFLQLSHC